MSGSNATVIPVWRTPLAAAEAMRLRKTLVATPGLRTFFVGPEALDWGLLRDQWPTIERCVFPDHNFRSVKTYSDWMLKPDLYAAFRSFEFLLVVQLDAFIIKNPFELGLEYDYFGAPWRTPPRVGRSLVHGNLTFSRFSKNRRTLRVGNGGLSIRRSRAFEKFSEALVREKPTLPEDLMISYLGPDLGLRIAPPELAGSLFMETGAQGQAAEAVQRVYGFHGLESLNPILERELLGDNSSP